MHTAHLLAGCKLRPSPHTPTRNFKMDPLNNKTPVSLLHEICTRSNITPKYDLLQVEGAIHEPIFQYRLTLDYIGNCLEGK